MFNTPETLPVAIITDLSQCALYKCLYYCYYHCPGGSVFIDICCVCLCVKADYTKSTQMIFTEFGGTWAV